MSRLCYHYSMNTSVVSLEQLMSRAGLVVTAPSLPMHTGVSPLVPPKSSHSSEFKIMQHWGHLSPYYSVDSHGLPEATSIVPEQCHLEELHWLQRHGAR